MFAYISGKLAAKKPTQAVIDVQGIGYALMIPASSFQALPEVGKSARLLTYQYVREDAFQLFGFATEAERVVFEEMLSVSGIGPKLALAALSAMTPHELRDAVLQNDIGLLTRIPGVGRKTASRVAIELRDRLDKLELGGEETRPRTPEVTAARADALAALVSLGLSRAKAERNLRKALREHPGPHSAEDLIRLALRENV